MDQKSAIILEGGAMRSIFSAGVVDFLLEKGIKIPNVLAVSAGAYAGMNYVSGQIGRVLDAVINPLREYKYMGLSTFLKKGTFFDMDYLFDEIPFKKAPFDFEKFKESAMRFITSTVNCDTGETVYHEDYRDEKELFRICKAANSLPIIAKVTEIGGVPMLDGGMAEAIPIKKALEEGWEKILVVFTRDSAYRKKEGVTAYVRTVRFLYRRYPEFARIVEGRAKRYNDAIDAVAALEREGRAMVLRPTALTVGNKESNVEKLIAYYRHGYETAKAKYAELIKFFEL